MVARYHTAEQKTVCPICGKPMKMGERVMVQLSWELGKRDVRVSRTSLVGKDCAELIAAGIGLEIPEEVNHGKDECGRR